jgi:hypothetical protein
MPTEECMLLHREMAVASARPLIDLVTPILDEAVNYSLLALIRSNGAGDHDNRRHNAIPLVLFRHVIEMVDGIAALLAKSCVVPAIPALRSAFEAELSLEYILQSDTERRSLSWLCCYGHQQLEYYEMLDQSTDRGREFEAARQEEGHGHADRQPSLPQKIKSYQDLLAQPYMAPIEARYQEKRHGRKDRKRGSVRWYSLFDNDVRTLRSLAKRVQQLTEYNLLYGKWSLLSHGSDFGTFVAITPRGQEAFKTLRCPEELQIVGALAAQIAKRALVATTDHFRPGELGRDRWVQELDKGIAEFLRPVEWATEMLG